MEEEDSITLSESSTTEVMAENSAMGELEPVREIQEDIDFQIKEEDAKEIEKCRKRKHSIVWAHFNLEAQPSGVLMAVCKYCKVAKYSSDGQTETTTLHRHLDRCAEYKKVNKKETRGKQIDQYEYRRLVAEAIIDHGYSFSWVEHPRIRKLHARLNDQIQPISRNTAKRDCLVVHNEMKAALKKVLKDLPGRICCTSDLWTSINTKSYMCLTAQYIDEDWKIQSKVLCFRHCPPPHGGFELAQEMRQALSEWGIENKVFSLTLDNATNNDKMISILKQGVFKDMVCGGKYSRIRCSAHSLNLVVKDGLQLIKPLVAKVRDGVRYIVGSKARIQKFAECVKNFEVPMSAKLSLDVPSRWNSTYIMLDKALKYRNAINYYFIGVDGGSDCILNPCEWAKVEKICNLLEPFNAVTEMFSGSEYPTANLFFPQVWKIHNRLESIANCNDTDISDAAIHMLEKFDKYWAYFTPILKFAIILDPRFKLRFVLFALSKQHGDIEGKRMTKEVELQFDELYTAYGGAGATLVSARNDELGGFDDLDGLEEFASLDQVSTSEVDIYLREKSYPVTMKLDVLNFWKENSSRFPVLSSMARDILAIPITSIASESTFSMGGRILSKWRSSLLPKNVEALVTTQNWLNGYGEVESLEEEEE